MVVLYGIFAVMLSLYFIVTLLIRMFLMEEGHTKVVYLPLPILLAIVMLNLGCTAGSISYVRTSCYHRKGALMVMIFGVIGGIAGARVVQYLDSSILPYFAILSLVVAIVKVLRDSGESAAA